MVRWYRTPGRSTHSPNEGRVIDIERNLLSKVLSEQSLLPVLEYKITPEFFTDEEHGAAFKWMLDFWNEYGEVPSVKVFRSTFPLYRLIATSEPYQYYLDELRKRRRYVVLVDSFQDAADSLEERDTDVAIVKIQRGLVKISTEVTSLKDEDLILSWESRLARYQRLRDHPGLIGIPTGFPIIDLTTSGMQPEQLITLVGLPKVGKSTILLASAISTHVYGKVPLFASFEMSNEEQEARYDAMRAGIDHQNLITGRLSEREEALLEASLRRIKNMQPFYLSSDTSAMTTVSGIAAKVEQYDPDVVFIDGVYLMVDEQGEPSGSPAALTNITRNLKRLAQRKKVPIMISTQLLGWKFSKKHGATMDAIGYSSSFAQDSDVILGIEDTDADDLKRLRVVAARSCPPKSVMVRWSWGTGEFEELSEDEDQPVPQDWN